MAKVVKVKTTKPRTAKSKTAKTKVAKNAKTSSLAKVSDMSSKGVGKYVGKTNISKRAYKLETKALRNERLGMQGKPAVIRAAGEALAMNTSPAFASYGVGTGIAAIDNNKSQQRQISDLINGGANIAGRENEEELNSSNNALPGGMVTR